MVQYLQKLPKFLIYWKLNLFSGTFSQFSRRRSGSQSLTISGFQSEDVGDCYYLGCHCSRMFKQWFIAVQEPPSVWLKAAGAACWTVMRITDPLTQESSTTNTLNKTKTKEVYNCVYSDSTFIFIIKFMSTFFKCNDRNWCLPICWGLVVNYKHNQSSMNSKLFCGYWHFNFSFFSRNP